MLGTYMLKLVCALRGHRWTYTGDDPWAGKDIYCERCKKTPLK